MKRKAAIFLPLMAIAAGGLAAFVSSSDAASERPQAVIPLFRIGVVGNVGTLNMAQAVIGNFVAPYGLETLVAKDSRGQIAPWLAQRVTHPGPNIYVYYLRKNVKFWDGAPLTADDVANSLNFWRAPKSQAAFGFTSVKSVTALDRYRVSVTLKHPDPGWKYAAAVNAALIFEKRAQLAAGAKFGQPGSLPVGTGPWKFDSLNPLAGAELSANPHWWGGQVPIRHLSIKFFSEENSEALAFRAGAIDAALPSDTKAFAATGNTNPVTWPSCFEIFFSMNTKVPPWNDIHVRRAVAYAANRAELVGANGGYGVPVSTFLPASLFRTIASQSQINALMKTVPQYPFDLSKAKAELAKSAYPNGFKVTLDDPIGYGNLTTIGQAFASQLKKIGIDATPNNVQIGPWISELAGPVDKRPATLFAGTCESPTLNGYDWALGSKNARPGAFNIGNYTPAVVDELNDAGTRAASPAKAFATYSKLLTQLQTDLPYLPLFLRTNSLALSSKFKLDIQPANLGPESPGTWNGTWVLHVKPS